MLDNGPGYFVILHVMEDWIYLVMIDIPLCLDLAPLNLESFGRQTTHETDAAYRYKR